MVSDSITDSELFYGSPISRDFSKKRKANWFWKLKQWKNDARHRQRIYQWKRENVGEMENGCRLKFLQDKLTDIKKVSDDDAFSCFQAWSVDHKQGRRYSGFIKCDDYDDDDETDFDRALSASSPTSVLKNKDLDSNKSGDDCFCCSKNLSEEDEEEEEVFDDAFDNWDNFSDALNVFENEDNEGTLHKKTTEEDSNLKTRQRKKKKSNSKNLFHKDNKCKPKTSPRKAAIQEDKSKKSEQQQQECECPICSEKMDATDLSFLPCPCGFRVCLFCHNTINENDGRCPSCRKKYDLVEK